MQIRRVKAWNIHHMNILRSSTFPRMLGGLGGGVVINPRRTCAARVTVLGLCVCVCVCVCVCLSVCLLLNISLFTCLFVAQTILTFSAADEGRKF